MKLIVLKEADAAETRVAASPETVKKLVGLGLSVVVEAAAGAKSNMSDKAYADAGATIARNRAVAIKGADIILGVKAPTAAQLKGAARGAVVIGTLNPYANASLMRSYASAGLTSLAMELMPRITRAQSMDILSSQSNLAGYKAVLDAANEYSCALPMMMTAAGTVPAARVFIMGAGVAGLQAIATAKRLGAIVSATDVRAAAKEQVESLGGSFVMVDADEGDSGETAGGYAKEMSADYKKRQAALVADHIAKQDIVITTALIPGRPAPELVSTKMVESMKAGSVIVDLAAEQGGNCSLTKPGKVIQHKGVTIMGHLNNAGRLAGNASALYARNLFNLIDAFWDKENKTLALNWEDEIIKGIALTHEGAVIHPILGDKKPAARKAASSKPASAKTASAKTASAKPAARKAPTKKAAPAAKAASKVAAKKPSTGRGATRQTKGTK